MVYMNVWTDDCKSCFFEGVKTAGDDRLTSRLKVKDASSSGDVILHIPVKVTKL